MIDPAYQKIEELRGVYDKYNFELLLGRPCGIFEFAGYVGIYEVIKTMEPTLSFEDAYFKLFTQKSIDNSFYGNQSCAGCGGGEVI